MSNWSHVAAIVRVDGFPWQSMDVERLFGRTLNWNDDTYAWDAAENNPDDYLPMGSEGSLQMSVWTNPDENCMARWTVSIFGDLWDHHDPEGIIEWFKAKVGDISFVRNAVIVVNNEWSGKTLTWGLEE